MKSIYSLLILVSLSAQSLFAQHASSDFYTKKGAAIAGFDVVSYHTGQPQKGKKSYAVTYKNTVFLFATPDNQAAFKANPARYLPQYGGYCAYALATNGKKVSINPSSFLIENNQLFLFYNSWGTDTRALWVEAGGSHTLKPKADASWEALNQ